MITEDDNIVGDGNLPPPQEALTGDLVADLVPTDKTNLLSNKIGLSPEELEDLLDEAAYRGYQLAEAKRQQYITTPDGLPDKTISGYKPLPYNTALSQSSSLLLVEGTGKEEWGGDPPFELSPELISEINNRLFSVYPRPILLSERCQTKE